MPTKDDATGREEARLAESVVAVWEGAKAVLGLNDDANTMTAAAKLPRAETDRSLVIILLFLLGLSIIINCFLKWYLASPVVPLGSYFQINYLFIVCAEITKEGNAIKNKNADDAMVEDRRRTDPFWERRSQRREIV